jgi:hypothetical protein
VSLVLVYTPHIFSTWYNCECKRRSKNTGKSIALKIKKIKHGITIGYLQDNLTTRRKDLEICSCTILLSSSLSTCSKSLGLIPLQSNSPNPSALTATLRLQFGEVQNFGIFSVLGFLPAKLIKGIYEADQGYLINRYCLAFSIWFDIKQGFVLNPRFEIVNGTCYHI